LTYKTTTGKAIDTDWQPYSLHPSFKVVNIKCNNLGKVCKEKSIEKEWVCGD